MSGARLRMSIDDEYKDPNFHYAWINDQRSNIFDAKRAGYEHVFVSEIPSWGVRDVDSANPVSDVISMTVNRDGTKAYLMKQPMEFHKEDEEAHDRLWKAREADMKKDLNSGTEGRYGSVEIK